MADTREKLIELIGRTPCCGFSSVAAVENIADYLIANGVTVQEWIPVTERLPEVECCTYSVDVLFYEYEEGIHVGYVSFETGVWKDRYSRDLYAEDKVTHWMPQPSTEGLG